MDRNLPGNLNPAEARWTQAALPEHNARFLPANASYARWISCPWAQFSLGFISHSTLVSSVAARRAPAPSACALRMHTGRRQRRFLVGAGLGLLLGSTTDVLRPMPADAGVGAAVSMKDIMDQQEAARKACWPLAIHSVNIWPSIIDCGTASSEAKAPDCSSGTQ